MPKIKNQQNCQKNLPKCKICGLTKEITFEGDVVLYPCYSCPKHGPDEINEWKIWWDKYSKIGLKKEYWIDKKNIPSCIISFFCFKFKEFYNFNYTMDYTSPIPYKNKEFTMARRIMTMFGEEYMQIPNYIKWVFMKKIKNTKYSLTSLGFFASSKFINEYKYARSLKNKINRSTPLPMEFLQKLEKDYQNFIKNNEIRTFNDLNILIFTAQEYKNSQEAEIVNEAKKFKLIPENGFLFLE
jgi:hypothetical protein